MYLTYQPQGSEEPQRWKYSVRLINTMEREAIERKTGATFAEFTQLVLKGSSLCRRALLFTYLRRQHPGLRWEDCTFDDWNEVRLEYSKEEWEEQRRQAIDNLGGDELASALQQIDKELETAFTDPDDGGKAQRPFAD